MNIPYRGHPPLRDTQVDWNKCIKVLKVGQFFEGRLNNGFGVIRLIFYRLPKAFLGSIGSTKCPLNSLGRINLVSRWNGLLHEFKKNYHIYILQR